MKNEGYGWGLTPAQIKAETNLNGFNHYGQASNGKRSLGERDKKILYDLVKKKCENCGKEIEYKEMQSGHKKAASKKGKATLSNSVGLCWSCNNQQGKDSWETFRKKQNKSIGPTATSHLKKKRSEQQSKKPKKGKRTQSLDVWGNPQFKLPKQTKFNWGI